MVELPNDEDFAPRLSFSVKRSLLAYVEPDDYVLTVHGSICTDDDTEIGRLLGYIIQLNRAINEVRFPLHSGHDSGPIPATHSGVKQPPFRSIPATPSGGLKSTV